MASHNHFLLIVIIISFFPILNRTILTASSSFNVSVRYPNASIKMRVILDMRRIRQTLQPYRSLLRSRELYREYYNMFKTLWTCCPLQRAFLFDTRNVHQSILDMINCQENIKHNQSRLSTQCLSNLKLFNPTTRDLPKCDGGLLRNIANEYPFVVQLYNYTEQFCVDGLHPNLIFFNISQIIQCERAIRQRLVNNPYAYDIYDTLSNSLLRIYVQNLNNYSDCNSSESSENEEQPTKLMYYY
ncbi:unnamed protein product [Adineta steineri]|uniref:Uncharacterized protein n=1 Tax=Adineta steineri TaxID=433720 RepID=A0A815J1N9_9BILA|nr:unnamed protein product [Adineta steineri]CAF1604711.1 unnamed protein product [Adineta steineri]